MAIEHRDIPDGERHEPKGASTALAGYSLVANGDGTTTWAPAGGGTTAWVNMLYGEGETDQIPAANDIPEEVSFGPEQGSSTSVVRMFSNGLLEFSSGGIFRISVTLNFGGGVSGGRMFARGVLDGVKVGHTMFANPAAEAIHEITQDFWLQVSQGSEFLVELVRNSGGGATGGLIGVVPTTVSWPASPSSSITVSRMSR